MKMLKDVEYVLSAKKRTRKVDLNLRCNVSKDFYKGKL
jgi:hypothetical protein